MRVKRRNPSTKVSSRRLVAEMVSRPRATSASSGRPRWSSVSLSEVIGEREFMISCVRMRVSLLHDSICISLNSLLMSLTETTRSRCFSRTISAQPSVRAISPLSVMHETWSFSPGRMARRARKASGAGVFELADVGQAVQSEDPQRLAVGLVDAAGVVDGDQARLGALHDELVVTLAFLGALLRLEEDLLDAVERGVEHRAVHLRGSSLKRKVMSSLSTASNMKLTRRIVLPKRCSSR